VPGSCLANAEEEMSMQRVTVVRYTTKSDRSDANEALTRAVFAELEGKADQPFSYAVFRNGDDFLHLFVNLTEDDASGLTELASFKRFSESGADRWTAPPETIRVGMELVASYGFPRANENRVKPEPDVNG
jgi:hypothetical protein